MKKTWTNTAVMCVTYADGCLWFNNNDVILNTRHDLDSFFDSSYCKDVRSFYVLALPENSKLICRAFDVGRSRELSVYLASPGLVGVSRAQKNPRTLLNNCFELIKTDERYPASVGGWHRMQEFELPFYQAAVLSQNKSVAAASLPQIFASHPLFRRLQFISPCNVEMLAKLLAELRDPRWYVDPSDPDQYMRLYSYVGVGTAKSANKSLRHAAEAVWRAKGHNLHEIVRQPRAFLLRQFSRYSSDANARARATTRLMLRFFVGVWRQWLYEACGYTGESLFVPEYFFSAELCPRIKIKNGDDNFAADVAAEYRRYVSTIPAIASE